MNHFSYPQLLSKSIFLKNPKISFPKQNPRPQTIEPAPRIFNYRVPPWVTKVDNIQNPCLSLKSGFSFIFLVSEFYSHGQTWYQKFIGTYLPLASVMEKSPQMMVCSHFEVDQFHHTVFDLGYLYLVQQQGTLANLEHLCNS